MSRYQWVITVDKIADFGEKPGTNRNAVGLCGPSDTTMTPGDIKRHPRRHRFRMSDDDGMVYYYGFYVGDRSSDDTFRPLDDFGRPNAGCVHIEYWNDVLKHWSEL